MACNCKKEIMKRILDIRKEYAPDHYPASYWEKALKVVVGFCRRGRNAVPVVRILKRSDNPAK